VTSLARAREVVNYRLTLEHEACRAAAAVLLGLDLVEVRAVPVPGCRGRIKVQKPARRPREFAMAVLVGPLLDPRLVEGEVPRWQLVPLDGQDGDQKQLGARRADGLRPG